MSTAAWATIGTVVATLVFLVVPGVIYVWCAIEHMIGDSRTYARAIPDDVYSGVVRGGGAVWVGSSGRNPATLCRNDASAVTAEATTANSNAFP